MRKFYIFFAALFFAGCSFRPQMPTVDTSFESSNDDRLNALIDAALAKNTDLRIAFLNLQKAKVSLGVAQSDLLPSLKLNTSVARGANGVDTNPKNSYGINLGLNYELDLWGRVRNSVEAAKALLNATEFDYNTARLSISSSVTKSYFALVALKMRVYFCRVRRQLRVQMLACLR